MTPLVDIEKSSLIAAIGHEGDTLAVRFKTGAVYHYSNVSTEIYESFLGAESAGKFFGANIRGKFPDQRIDTEPEE